MTATTDPVFLKTTQQLTIHTNWLTYAEDRNGPSPVVGLGEYLARQLLNAPAGYEIELLEAGNDTDHKIDVKLDDHDRGPIWVAERAELVDKLRAGYARELVENEGIPADQAYRRKRFVGIEEYHLRTLMLAAHERGVLAPGLYVVTLSW